jgi:hypothetical protein
MNDKIKIEYEKAPIKWVTVKLDYSDFVRTLAAVRQTWPANNSVRKTWEDFTDEVDGE